MKATLYILIAIVIAIINTAYPIVGCALIGGFIGWHYATCERNNHA